MRLRRFTGEDVAAYFGIFSDPEVMRFMSYPAFTDRVQAQQKVDELLAHYASGDRFELAIERQADGQLLGSCTLHHIHVQSRRAEVGYALGRHYWGKGYMHEAMAALVDYAFTEMRLHRLEADIDPRNTASVKSLERLGFVREGYLRERWIVAGEISDSALYGLLAADHARAKGIPRKAAQIHQES